MSLFSRFFQQKSTSSIEDAVTVDLFDEGFLRRLSTLALMCRRATAGVRRGERRSRKRGGGVEFADHRAYVPGDDIRFLDVAIYQRFGKLQLRLYEEEEDLSLYFLMDTSASMAAGGGGKLNQSARVAAALAYVSLSGLDRVSVLALTDRVAARLAPTRGRQRVFQVLGFLSRLRASGVTDLGQAIKAFVAQNQRRGVALVFSDFYDPAGFRAGLDVLRFNKFEVVALELVDKKAEEWSLTGDLEVVDGETGASREVSMTSDVLAKIRQETGRRREEFARYCAAHQVSHFVVDVDTPFDEVVLKVLRGGGLLT